MKRHSPLDYAFAIGRVRALEKFLIPSEAFTEAIEVGLEDALRIFAESSLYSDELLHIRNSQELEEILNKELLKLRGLIKSLLVDKELFPLVESEGLIKIQSAFRKSASQFLNDYSMHLVDMHNIKTFLRLYFLKEPQEKLELFITCEPRPTHAKAWVGRGEGFINKKTLIDCFSQDITVFLNRLEFVHKRNEIVNYADFLKEPIAKIREGNSFVSLEKAINDFLIQILRPAIYISLGPEPLVAYYLAKVNEINLMRMIILAKLNNVSVDLVKERLNLVYA